jgi:hypothetical protein
VKIVERRSMGNEKDASAVYEDRNLAGMALAITAIDTGYAAGWYVDDESEWGKGDIPGPVVWASLPTGEVSWHLPPTRVATLEASNLPNERPPGGYDGYSREDKNDRLLRYIETMEVDR